ncbi:M3 family oligoendopeptidase [Dictyobacter arantiisoli]|uniref:Oligoendopeptidase F n=1 Tax=Dictyobacter arantiisoli TaxID=2014874 RepID=A0A5A5T7G0_9CHLR|nr:M3 family oligoendopeptidase [Dictyobacter arantiisoli]GCF06854.1 oligoendopeptidase F [Dictyobacter arantiisoli]
MTTTPSLPRWNMSVIYPGLDSPEFDQGFADVVHSIQMLGQLFDTHHIEKQDAQHVEEALQQTFETVIAQYNSVLEDVQTLSVYINCFVTTNSRDALAQARASELQKYLVQLSLLSTRFTAWLGSLGVERLIAVSPVAAEHAYILRQAKIEVAHMMSPAEERLAAELNSSSGRAWSKLHGNITSQLVVSLEIDGQVQQVPMSVVRSLASSTDRDLRQRAYEAELAAWKDATVPLAAALNSIKGEVNTLATHRHWESALDESLFANSIDRETLQAMLSAAKASFPAFRRYMHAKAQALNIPRMAWYDIFAPLGSMKRSWDFKDAEQFIVEQFGTYSERLSTYAARAFHEHWIDAEPRPGKRDGAYCTPLRGDESRVFANFKPNFDGVTTLAHELGHGYHNVNLARRTALQRSLPMTLAETASIFCETIINHAALQKADRQERIAILESSIQGSCQVVVDITSRFLFEQQVFESRQQRELSVEELNALMLQAQRDTYGDGLDEQSLHPYMWAVKQHYYSTGLSYYNYPYMFGLLFGLGLYAQYQQDPETFKQNYDDLLSSTGLADAATLAARFGIDLHAESFWTASLDIVRQEIDTFCELIQSEG